MAVSARGPMRPNGSKIQKMEKLKCNVSVEEALPSNNSRRMSKSSATLLPNQSQQVGS